MAYNKKVLLCAYACEPNKGSEPGVGWETAINLALEDAETNYFVITRANNKICIENESHPKNLIFIYYDLSSVFLFIKKKGNFARIYYYLWMFGAVLKLWRRRSEFQIIHHITFVNDWLPSLFILLKNKENYFVWGPIGSHDSISSKFLNSERERVIERARILLQKIFRTFDLFFWLCKLKSDLIIGINENVANKIKINHSNLGKFRCLPAIAVKEDELTFKKIINERPEKFKIISVGRLMYIKNFKLTLNSYAFFLKLIPIEEKNKIELIIIGDGELRKELKMFVKDLKIDNNVTFKGHMNQNEVLANFKDSDLFLFPTLESAGFVVLEAMTYCLPIIALDYGGPKQFIKEGMQEQLVSAKGDINGITKELSNKILHFYNNPELRIEIGNNNQISVMENLTWKSKTNYILKLYEELA